LHEVAREADPQAFLIVNDYGYYDELCRFKKFFKDNEKNSRLYDAIGIQAHAPEHTWYRPKKWVEVLDNMAEFGKPIHITEYFVPSDGTIVEGISDQRIWDEKNQAEAAVEFYKICFSHPGVEAITWWDLTDKKAWQEGTGLLREDLSEKKVYNELYKLIHETWHTSLEGHTNESGAFDFRGFSGTYDVFVKLPDGRKRALEINIKPMKDNRLIVEFP
jgi:GH35 family endo-1,4-beta-xylanase